MHTAALHGEYVNQDAREYGWQVQEAKHDWKTLVDNVQNHIRSIHFGYRVDMQQNEIKNINARAKFIDPHTIQVTDAKGNVSKITSKRFVIAVGGMPNYPTIPGALEYGITSDEMFALVEPPGKTLVVGAAYIALENAGFLTGLGYDTTVMMRSIPLRGFDQECAEKIVNYMEVKGTKFIKQAVPTSITKVGEKLYRVEYEQDGTTRSEEYNTILFAIGRTSIARELDIERLGVRLNDKGKVIVNEHEQTDVPHIYAIGDCIDVSIINSTTNVLQRGIELTPVAIHAGSLLAKRIYSEDLPDKNSIMDYMNVPTTVFTPLEYGCCGMSEEYANKKFGEDNVEVYLVSFTPLEHEFAHRDTNNTFMKIICNKADNERVVGFHYCGPHAGEITQGTAVAIRLGATKQDFDNTIGIHPTIAEEMTKLGITRRSGQLAEKKGC